MHLLALTHAVPAHAYTQEEVFAALSSSTAFGQLQPRGRHLLEKILTGCSGIETRQFCRADLDSLFHLSAEELNRYYEDAAPRLAVAAAHRALEQSAAAATAIDALFICTCTGYLCPGLSSHVAEQLGLREDVFLADMVGLGCGAAIPTLRAAQGFLAQRPDACVLVVAVEVCSAAFYINDDPGVLISLCLFGDGASASLWRGGAAPADAWEIGHFRTLHRPQHREHIRFVNDSGRLKNRLDRCVPALAAEAVAQLHAQRHHPRVQCLTHGGGRDVLDALESPLGIALTTSRRVLAQHGNMSSPSVLFALEQHLRHRTSDEALWLSSFGAGFAAHSCEMWRAEAAPSC